MFRKIPSDSEAQLKKQSMRRGGPARIPVEEHVKRKFTPEEDNIIRNMVGDGEPPSWSIISRSLVGRSARQCRERWRHYLWPQISPEPWSAEEDSRLRDAFDLTGPRWSIIAQRFPGRTEVNVKNRWSILKRRWVRERNRNGQQRRKKNILSPTAEPLPGIGEIIALDTGPREPSPQLGMIDFLASLEMTTPKSRQRAVVPP
jgi:hypothetical protein